MEDLKKWNLDLRHKHANLQQRYQGNAKPQMWTDAHQCNRGHHNEQQ